MYRPVRFKSKAERFAWMLETSPEMVRVLKECKEAFGPIKLSNVGKNTPSEIIQNKKAWEKK